MFLLQKHSCKISRSFTEKLEIYDLIKINNNKTLRITIRITLMLYLMKNYGDILSRQVTEGNLLLFLIKINNNKIIPKK